MLINILKSMHARIKLKEDKEKEQNSEIEENKRQIKMLEEKNKQVSVVKLSGLFS